MECSTAMIIMLYFFHFLKVNVNFVLLGASCTCYMPFNTQVCVSFSNSSHISNSLLYPFLLTNHLIPRKTRK